MFQLHELSKRPSAKPRTITRHLIQPHGWPTRPPVKFRTSKWHLFRLHELPKRPSVKPRKPQKPHLAEPKCGLDTNAWTTLQKYGREICPQELFIFLIIFTAHPNNLQLCMFLWFFKTQRARLQLFLCLEQRFRSEVAHGRCARIPGEQPLCSSPGSRQNRAHHRSATSQNRCLDFVAPPRQQSL